MTVRHALLCLRAVFVREMLRFVRQRERFLAALVRPLLWLLVFAAGLRMALGIAITPPYQTYITYEVYIVPGLIGMIQLFNGMQSSLSMVYDREMGSMRVLLTTPLPRWFLLVCKLLAGVAVSIVQVYAFIAIALAFGIDLPWAGLLTVLPALVVLRADAGRDRPAAVDDDPPAGELRRGHEFRHLPDVLPVLGALSAVEDARGAECCCGACARSTRSPGLSS